MLTRRHIRVKVMQCIYALILSKDESLDKQDKFLKVSIENTYVLYLLVIDLFRELHKLFAKHARHATNKYITQSDEAYPDADKFLKNRLMLQIVDNKELSEEIERRKMKNWYLHEEYIKIIHREIIANDKYKAYMSSADNGYEADRDIVIELFKDVIAPNEKLYSYYEDDKLTWVDDLPLVNTFVLKMFRKVNEFSKDSFFLPKLLKDQDDMTYARDLLSKTLLKNDSLEKEIEGKTPNWDKDRIAEIDAILLKMAICELLYFPTIPERVTINEYLEIAKEYSTPKSSIFINGILDKLVKEYKSEGKLKKTGRGLL